MTNTSPPFRSPRRRVSACWPSLPSVIAAKQFSSLTRNLQPTTKHARTSGGAAATWPPWFLDDPPRHPPSPVPPLLLAAASRSNSRGQQLRRMPGPESIRSPPPTPVRGQAAPSACSVLHHFQGWSVMLPAPAELSPSASATPGSSAGRSRGAALLLPPASFHVQRPLHQPAQVGSGRGRPWEGVRSPGLLQRPLDAPTPAR